MTEPVIVFTTSSDIEASVVIALLDSHGIQGFRVSGNANAILPMAVNPLGGQIRVAVPQGVAEDARRVIASHREDVGSRVVRQGHELPPASRVVCVQVSCPPACVITSRQDSS